MTPRTIKLHTWQHPVFSAFTLAFEYHGDKQPYPFELWQCHPDEGLVLYRRCIALPEALSAARRWGAET